MTENIPNPNKIAGYQTLVPNFDGELFSNVTYFLKSLDDISNIAQWEDPETIAVFKSKLKGPALQYFIADPELTTETKFAKIKAKFEKYFAPKSTLSHRQQMFSNCKQFPGESVRSFAARVSNLTITYFGQENTLKEDAQTIVNQTKLAKFLEGLHPSLRRLALTRQHTSFEDAVDQCTVDELNSQMTESTETINAANSQPQTNIESKLTQIIQRQAEESNKLLQTLTEQLKSISIRNQQLPSRNPNRFRQCIYCKRSNHKSEDCYSLRRNSNDQNIPNRRFINTRTNNDDSRNPPNPRQTFRSNTTQYNQRPRNQADLNCNGNR